MGRIYNVGAVNQTVLGATTLVAIRPSASVALRILKMEVDQHANATSAQCVLRWGRKGAALGTYVSATPSKIADADPASAISGGTAGAAGTVGVNASAEGAGSVSVLREGVAFNSLSGFLWLPRPDEVIVCQAGSATPFVLQFQAAPGTLTGWNWNLQFEEVG
jgi:hypothetical protein